MIWVIKNLIYKEKYLAVSLLVLVISRKPVCHSDSVVDINWILILVVLAEYSEMSTHVYRHVLGF